ncbi:hypothetical protein D9M71_758050 [compost metagenome]
MLGEAARTGEKLDLQQVQRVEVGIAHTDRLAQHGVAAEQLRLASQTQHRVDGLRQQVAQLLPQRAQVFLDQTFVI